MLTYLLGIASWQFWLLFTFIILFLLYIICGGGNYKVIGIAPLDARQNLKDVIGSEEYRKHKEELTPLAPGQQNSGGHNSSGHNSSGQSGESVDVRDIVKKLRDGTDHAEDDGMNVSIDMTPKIPMEILNKKKRRQLEPKRKTSKKEELCRQIIEEIYQKPFPPARPDWLKNPDTGRPLELDCYNDDLKIALEYNGQQHYCFPNHTGQNKESFIAQVRRDIFKVNKCDEHGVFLINVPYTVPDHLLKEYIAYYTPESLEARINKGQ